MPQQVTQTCTKKIGLADCLHRQRSPSTHRHLAGLRLRVPWADGNAYNYVCISYCFARCTTKAVGVWSCKKLISTAQNLKSITLRFIKTGLLAQVFGGGRASVRIDMCTMRLLLKVEKWSKRLSRAAQAFDNIDMEKH